MTAIRSGAEALLFPLLQPPPPPPTPRQRKNSVSLLFYYFFDSALLSYLRFVAISICPFDSVVFKWDDSSSVLHSSGSARTLSNNVRLYSTNTREYKYRFYRFWRLSLLKENNSGFIFQLDRPFSFYSPTPLDFIEKQYPALFSLFFLFNFYVSHSVWVARILSQIQCSLKRPAYFAFVFSSFFSTSHLFPGGPAGC